MSQPTGSRFEVHTALALARANARYWPTVAPRVHRGLRYWRGRAEAIPDPALRGEAIAKLDGERFNTEVAATLATLVPRRLRAQTIEAIVALQVLYDYLDGLSEQPASDPIENSRLLFSSFQTALTPEPGPAVDYYRLHSRREDGGYMEALASACRDAFAGLPSAAVVAPVARRAAARCGESQTRTHAIESLGIQQLQDWATGEADGTGLAWWEYVAGATASVLCVHALIAAAADPRTSDAEAHDLDTAYLFTSTVSTLLDSLIDQRWDVAEESHSFVAYYPSEEVKVTRIGIVSGRAATGAYGLRHGSHHYMTAVGVAAYYLSAREAGHPANRQVKDRVVEELRPLIKPILGIFYLWRLGKVAATPFRRPPPG